jgi:hypothetical protein
MAIGQGSIAEGGPPRRDGAIRPLRWDRHGLFGVIIRALFSTATTPSTSVAARAALFSRGK